MGGMLVGTFFGVIIIPGLYYVFDTMAEGRNLIKGEQHEPLSEEYVHTMEDRDKMLKKIHQDRLESDQEGDSK